MLPARLYQLYRYMLSEMTDGYAREVQTFPVKCSASIHAAMNRLSSYRHIISGMTDC